MANFIGSSELLKEMMKPHDNHGVIYDEETNCIVFTHMYVNLENPEEGGYDIDLGSFHDVKTTLEEFEHILSKPQIQKEHIKEFVRLALIHGGK